MELGATDTPTRTAGLRADGTTRITRLFFGSRTVIRKEPLGSGAEARLAHETAILERLRGAQGVAQLLDTPRYPGSIVLADAGGESLAELAKPFGGAELIELATELARAVASMHARGVIHRDIHPGNVVWSRDRGCCLVDFARATTLAEIRPQFAHHSEIVGALPYVAPEQTGRTGRSVDHRADLYGLVSSLSGRILGRGALCQRTERERLFWAMTGGNDGRRLLVDAALALVVVDTPREGLHGRRL